MPTYRGNAIAVRVLFILCSAAAILSIVPLAAPAADTQTPNGGLAIGTAAVTTGVTGALFLTRTRRQFRRNQ